MKIKKILINIIYIVFISIIVMGIFTYGDSVITNNEITSPLFTQDNYEVMDSTDNTTMTSYVNSQNIVYNTTMTSYVNSQDTVYNTTIKTYIDSQDIVYNTTMTTYADTKLPLSGGTVTGNITVDEIIHNDYWISAAPFLDENSANVANKPTLVPRGLFSGYSLPEYAAGEELLFRMRVPHRWDGSTNPWFVAITSISATEDVGDKYKFQLEWVSEDIEHIIPDNGIENITCEVTVVNGSAFYAEIIAFELDTATLVAGQNLQARLRRIEASSSSVSNEIIIWHWDTRWKMNRFGTVSVQGYDG